MDNLSFTTFDTWAHYLLHEQGKSERTVIEYRRDVEGFRRWLDEAAGKQGLPPSWNDLTPQHIRAYLTHLQTRKRGKKQGISKARTGRIIASLNSWFSYLRKVAKEITVNPVEDIEKPKLSKHLPQALEPDEVARILDAAWKYSREAERLRNWALLAFLYGTGLRVSEAVGLKLEDISYLDGFPVSVIVTGKGDKQRRVPLSPTAKEALFRWLKHRQYRGTPTDRHVWISTAGRSKHKPLTIQAVWYIATIAAKEAGVNKPASPHKYRHTFATQLRRSGRQLDEIRDLLGHSSISTTADIYARVDETHLVEAVNRLPVVQTGTAREPGRLEPSASANQVHAKNLRLL